MSEDRYSDMTNDQLAHAFLKISIDEADALGRSKMRVVNKLVKHLQAVEAVLRTRGPEARKVLVPLLTYQPGSLRLFADQIAQVRLNAAKELLAVVPDQARATLEDLAARGPSFQSGSAGMCLQLLDDGVFKPT